MSKELYWLVLTVAMTGLLWVPYILDRIMVRGTMGAMANPSPNDRPQSAWAQRMNAAHANTVENLVVFAPLVLTAQALNIHTASTAFACALFFAVISAFSTLSAFKRAVESSVRIGRLCSAGMPPALAHGASAVARSVRAACTGAARGQRGREIRMEPPKCADGEAISEDF